MFLRKETGCAGLPGQPVVDSNAPGPVVATKTGWMEQHVAEVTGPARSSAKLLQDDANTQRYVRRLQSFCHCETRRTVPPRGLYQATRSYNCIFFFLIFWVFNVIVTCAFMISVENWQVFGRLYMSSPGLPQYCSRNESNKSTSCDCGLF